ncbi:hypothetical protein PIB30_001948 [Stylosanthes scabra]|uniref:Uncharacterized protein n=1 Tax=Stylosanthes scabra TaxID=79078 RepID=A0ABU6Y1N8_9FABA|nr:hypothetical protein [Stylosanthes scabra]
MLKTPNVKAPPQGKRGLHKRHIGGAFTFGVFSVEAPLPLAPPMWKAIAALAPLEQETRPVLAPPSQHGKKNDSAANVANDSS